MDAVAEVRRQAERLWPLLLVLYVPVAAILLAIALFRLTVGIEVSDFLRDPVQFYEGPAYIGMVSVLGGLIWASTVAVCLFTHGLLRGRGASGSSARDGQFFLAAGGITALLMFDDVFMLHEVVLPDALGIPETVVFATYGALLLGFLARYRAWILQYDFLILLLALAALGASVAVDITDSLIPYPATYLWEDGAKLFGIVSWAAFFVSAAAHRLRESQSPPHRGRPTSRLDPRTLRPHPLRHPTPSPHTGRGLG